ncbi:MAG: TVP38/TMEM64 family protein [Proteobacteria bacterium]|nr:TVP38/TMEM64 family protein [Pseudomonadota bacterium]
MSPSPERSGIWRFAPLAAIAAGVALFFAFGLDRYLTFDALAENRAGLLAWTAANGALAGILFVLAYIAIVATSLPGAAVATLAGGFLFGTAVGGTLAVIGATIGASLLFLAARTALGDMLRAKAGPSLSRLEAGFRENALSYLLVLRLVPAFPFVLVNLAPAFLGVSLRVYVIGTFFGILPGTYVYASIGAGLGSVFDSGGRPDLGIVLSAPVLLPLLGLALLALVPVALRKFRKVPPP